MTVRVLGPLDVGEPPLSPRERTILSALIVRAGEALSPAELADAFWGEHTPQTWPAQVKTSVARIRRRLGAGAVTTLGGAYALGIDPDAIDAIRFERLVSSARQHALHDEFDRAVDAYDRALALWRGRPYPDLADWDPGAAESLRLEDIRRDAEEERLDARLHTADSRHAIPDAERLVHEAPLREERWALLALANYRAGRQAEALAALRTARSRLLDELGIEPGARLVALESAILQQDPALLDGPAPAQPSSECPYRGLAAFTPDDADAFFGRDADLDLLIDRVRPGTIVTVTGPSGSGKSSLAQAGLLARISGTRQRYAVIHPGVAGLPALRAAVARDGVDVLLIDQAEELVGADPADVDAFCRICAEFLDAGGTMIVTIRSDFLDAATALPRIGTMLGRGVYALAPVTADAYREIIERPARRAGLHCEPGLVEVVVRDVAGRTGSLPLVSYALVETWARREGSTLTIAGYEASGGIGGAIAAAAEDAYSAMSADGRELCRTLMLRLLERDADGTTLRRHPQAKPLQSDPARRAVLDRLTDARLVTTEGDALVIAHEAVATAWPRLDAWLEDDARGARILATVSAGSDAWDSAGRPDEDLLRGGRLQTIRDWQEQTRPDLTDVERSFLDASEARHADRVRRLETAARRDRRQNRLLRASLVAASVLLVGAVVAGGIAVARSQEATAAAEDALIQAITSRSEALQSTNRDIGALMAVAAVRSWPADARTNAALTGALTAAHGFIGPTYIKDAVWRIGAWPIPKTREVAVVRDQTALEIRDLDTGAKVRTLATDLPRTDQQIRPWVRVSADGSTIAIVQHWGVDDATRTETVWFFDLPSGRRVAGPVSVPELSEFVSLSTDGRFATWATDGVLSVVDRDSGAVRSTELIARNAGAPTSAAAAFDNEGRITATTISGDEWHIDPLTLERSDHVSYPSGFVGTYLSITADGTVFHEGRDGIMVADSTGRELWRQPFERPDECSRIAAASETGIAACGDELGTIELRDLRTGSLVTPAADYQLGGAGDLAFIDGGREMLLLSGIAPAIGRMRVDGSGPASRMVASGYQPVADLTGDSRLIVRAREEAPEGEPPSLAVWDTAADRAIFRIPQDVVGAYRGQLVDARWATSNSLVLANVLDPGTDHEHVDFLRLDLRTGRLASTDIPLDALDVYPSRDRTRLYAVADGETVVLDASTLRRTGPALAVSAPAWAVSDTPSHARVVITRFDEVAQHWDTIVLDGRSGRVIAHGLPTVVRSAVLNDGTVLGIGADSAALYDATTLTRIRALPHVRPAWLIDLTDDGRTAVIHGGGAEGTTLVDLASGATLGGALSTDQNSGGAWLSPTGDHLAAPTRDGILIRTLDRDTQIAAACRLAGREPTADEWETYLSALGEQHPLCSTR